MRGKPLLLIAGACVVGTLAVWMVRDLDAAPTVVEHVPVPEASAREAAPATRIEPARAAIQAQPSTTPEARASTAPDGSADPVERDRQVLATIDASLTEKLRAERVDAAWARDTQAAIANAVADPGFAGLRLDAVTCGSTLCRVAITAGEQVEDVSGLIEELTAAPPFRAGGFLRFTGTRAVTMFVARTGTKLPAQPRS